jgi:hypothetical protein
MRYVIVAHRRQLARVIQMVSAGCAARRRPAHLAGTLDADRLASAIGLMRSAHPGTEGKGDDDPQYLPGQERG